MIKKPSFQSKLTKTEIVSPSRSETKIVAFSFKNHKKSEDLTTPIKNTAPENICIFINFLHPNAYFNSKSRIK